LIAFAITWGLQMPGVLAQRGILPGDLRVYLPFVGLGAFGPLIAATLLSFREGGMTGVKRLYSPLLHWRVHGGWYLAALALPGVLLTGLLWILNLAGRQGPIAYVPATSGVIFGLMMSLVEEVGWRGYALPRLTAHWGPFTAGALIGGLWYLWHIPMFLGLGVPLDLGPVMLLYFVGASLFLTWIYRGTQGSLLLSVLAHLGAHLDNSHRALPADVVPLIAHTIIYAALGLFVMRRFAQANRHCPTPQLPSNCDTHG
jgi:membrane protease YdiL (CAAX protease family)